MLVCLVGCGKAKAEEKIAVFSWGEPTPTSYPVIYQSVDFTFEEGKPAGLVEEQVERIKNVFKGKELWLLAGNKRNNSKDRPSGYGLHSVLA